MSNNPSFSELRQRAGLSVENAAIELGYSAATVYRWEREETTPKIAVYRALQTLAQFSTPSSVPAQSQIGFRFIDLFAGIAFLRRSGTNTPKLLIRTILETTTPFMGTSENSRNRRKKFLNTMCYSQDFHASHSRLLGCRKRTRLVDLMDFCAILKGLYFLIQLKSSRIISRRPLF